MSVFPTNQPIPVTIPVLSLNKARVLAYFWEEGAKKADRMVKFDDAVKELERRYNCGFWHETQALRDEGTPPMLLFKPNHPEDNLLRLHETHFIDPVPLWAAINEAENKSGVSLSKVPGRAVKTVSAAPQQAAPTYKVGDTVMQDGRLCTLVEGAGGRLALEPVEVGSAAASTPTHPAFPGAGKTPETMSMQELRIGCKARGLSAGGSAAELRERVKSHDAAAATPALASSGTEVT